jgi:hypothetical protein
MARCAADVAELDAMRIRNRDGLQRFWAKHTGDALQVKKALEAIAADLSKKVQA